MKIKVSEATDNQLIWLVAKCLGHQWRNTEQGTQYSPAKTQCWQWWRPTTDWAQGGPIIEGEQISLMHDNDGTWRAEKENSEGDTEWFESGPTPLIAAIRCYVVSKLGDKVEVPEELA